MYCFMLLIMIHAATHFALSYLIDGHAQRRSSPFLPNIAEATGQNLFHYATHPFCGGESQKYRRRVAQSQGDTSDWSTTNGLLKQPDCTLIHCQYQRKYKTATAQTLVLCVKATWQERGCTEDGDAFIEDDVPRCGSGMDTWCRTMNNFVSICVCVVRCFIYIYIAIIS